MENVSAFGLKAYLIASRTLPVGILLDRFPDEVEPISMIDADSGEAVLDLNGKVIRWTQAAPLTVRLAVIPGSSEDSILGVIYNANRASATVPTASDSINLVVRYPDDSVHTITSGRVISGPPAPTAVASGRLSPSIYTYAFGDKYTLSTASVVNIVGSRFGIVDRVAGALGL